MTFIIVEHNSMYLMMACLILTGVEQSKLWFLRDDLGDRFSYW